MAVIAAGDGRRCYIGGRRSAGVAKEGHQCYQRRLSVLQGSAVRAASPRWRSYKPCRRSCNPPPAVLQMPPVRAATTTTGAATPTAGAASPQSELQREGCGAATGGPWCYKADGGARTPTPCCKAAPPPSGGAASGCLRCYKRRPGLLEAVDVDASSFGRSLPVVLQAWTRGLAGWPPAPAAALLHDGKVASPEVVGETRMRNPCGMPFGGRWCVFFLARGRC